MPKKIVSILILASFLFCGIKCTKGPDAETLNYSQKVDLTIWGVWDSSEDLAPLIAKYKAIYPYINIQYRRLRYEEYEKEVIEAFAADRGPDILAIHNTWIPEYQSKGLISPIPDKITMARLVVQGKIKKEMVQQLETKSSITIPELKKKFIDVVAHDVVVKEYNAETEKYTEKIYGLPLSVDTLAMFYNKDLFNNAGISDPPLYWNNVFQQDVKKLTKQNNKAQIIQSGVAMGGSSNIERSTDVLSVLMMQSGAEMMDANNRVLFNAVPAGMEKKYSPGLEALRFYTDFANPAKEVYCWNGQMPNSVDLFTQGKLAMLFGYSYMLPTIKANGPKVNFAIGKFPQIENNPTVNFANYWVYSVSNKILTNPTNLQIGQKYAKQKQAIAWNFIQFMADENQVAEYLEKTKRPTALRTLVDKQKENEELSVFADQLLTAKSWYKGYDANSTEEFFKEMVDNVVSGKTTLEDAISKAASKVRLTTKNASEN